MTMDKAKQLFTSYCGNTLAMYREGVLQEYKGFEVPKALETEWFGEMVDRNARELSIRDWKAIDELSAIASNYKDPAILEKVIAFTSRHMMSADSVVKLMVAERILEIINKIKLDIAQPLLYEAYKTTAIILEDVITKPLVIDPGHELHLYELKDKRSLNHRAERSIQQIKKDLSNLQ